MPLSPPIAPTLWQLGTLGLMSVTPTAVVTGYLSAGYATTNRANVAYTPNAQSSPFTGGLLDLLQAAKLSDLNTARVAMENQRALTEATAQRLNALLADLKDVGIINA